MTTTTDGTARAAAAVPVLDRFSAEDVRVFLSKLGVAAKEVPEPALETKRHRFFDELSAGLGEKKLKHFRQEAELLGRLLEEFVEASGLDGAAGGDRDVDRAAGSHDDDDELVLIELGCGTASLSLHAARVFAEAKVVVPTRHVLLDRMSFRAIHKCDRRILGVLNESDRRRAGAGAMAAGKDRAVRRFTTDIREWEWRQDLLDDLRLSAPHHVDTAAKTSRVILFSKHFCGVATDMALDLARDLSGAGVTVGVLMASCCHALCERGVGDWSFLGSDSIRLGGEQDFEMLKAFSGWASLSVPSTDDTATQDTATSPADADRCPVTHLDRREKREAGMVCKRLIDEARVRRFREMGWTTARRGRYTSDTVESGCLIAPFKLP